MHPDKYEKNYDNNIFKKVMPLNNCNIYTIAYREPL